MATDLKLIAEMATVLGAATTGGAAGGQPYRSRRYRDILPERTEYRGDANLEVALEGFDSQWCVLASGHPLLGQTIAKSDIKHQTGATIMAIERGSKRYSYPPGDTIFEEGDHLLGVGSAEEQEKFAQFIQQPDCNY